MLLLVQEWQPETSSQHLESCHWHMAYPNLSRVKLGYPDLCVIKKIRRYHRTKVPDCCPILSRDKHNSMSNSLGSAWGYNQLSLSINNKPFQRSNGSNIYVQYSARRRLLYACAATGRFNNLRVYNKFHAGMRSSAWLPVARFVEKGFEYKKIPGQAASHLVS